MIRMAWMALIATALVAPMASAGIPPQRSVPERRFPIVGGGPMFFDADGAPVNLSGLDGWL